MMQSSQFSQLLKDNHFDKCDVFINDMVHQHGIIYANGKLQEGFSHSLNLNAIKYLWENQQKLRNTSNVIKLTVNINILFMNACTSKQFDIIDYLFDLVDTFQHVHLNISALRYATLTRKSCIMELVWNRLSDIEREKINVRELLLFATKGCRFECFEWIYNLCISIHYPIENILNDKIVCYIAYTLTYHSQYVDDQNSMLDWLYDYSQKIGKSIIFSIEQLERIIIVNTLFKTNNPNIIEWFNVHNVQNIIINVERQFVNVITQDILKDYPFLKKTVSTEICPVCQEEENERSEESNDIYMLSCSTDTSKHCICGRCLCNCIYGDKIKFYRCVDCMKVHAFI